MSLRRSRFGAESNSRNFNSPTIDIACTLHRRVKRNFLRNLMELGYSGINTCPVNSEKNIYLFRDCTWNVFRSCSVQTRNASGHVEWHSNREDTPRLPPQWNNSKKTEIVKYQVATSLSSLRSAIVDHQQNQRSIKKSKQPRSRASKVCHRFWPGEIFAGKMKRPRSYVFGGWQ